MTNSQIEYTIVPTIRYKKQLRKIAKSGRLTKTNLQELTKVIDQLARKEKLPEKYRDHGLLNHPRGQREFHFRPDLLVICSYIENVLLLELGEIGSHADLF